MPVSLVAGLEGWLAPIALVLARVGGVAATAPAWNTPGLGWRIRFGLTILVTAIVCPGVLSDLEEARLAPTMLAGEAVVGAGMGLVMALIVAGARQAGELIGAQAGLATATVLDPEAGDGLTPTGHLYGLLATGTFLVLDGPLRLVTMLIESYRAVPVGGPSLSAETVQSLFAQVGWALGLSLRAAAPVGLALVVAGLALGSLARVGGGLQLASLTWPVRSIVGLILVLVSLTATAQLLGFEWSRMLAQGAGPEASSRAEAATPAPGRLPE
jgi:flagellar biosynthetic protein FliR